MIEESKKLAIKFRDGDEDAFKNLYHLLKGYVYNVIIQNGVNDSDAQDVMQEVFVEIYRKIDTLKDPQAMVKWTIIIARNKSIDYLRKYSREFVTDSQENDYIFEESAMVAPIEMPEDVMNNAETARLVQDIIDGLPEIQQKCIYFYYYNEMKTREIADALNCPEGTVKTNLVKARKNIENEVKLLAKKHGTKLFLIPIFGVIFFTFTEKAMAAEDSINVAEGVFDEIIKNCKTGAREAVMNGTHATQNVASIASGKVTGGLIKGIVSTIGIKGISIIAVAIVAAVITVSVVASNNSGHDDNSRITGAKSETKVTETKITEPATTEIETTTVNFEELMKTYSDAAVYICNDVSYEAFASDVEHYKNRSEEEKKAIPMAAPYTGDSYSYVGNVFIPTDGDTGTLIVICKAYYKSNNIPIAVSGGGACIYAKYSYMPVIFKNVNKNNDYETWKGMGNNYELMNAGFYADATFESNKNPSGNYFYYINGAYLYKYNLYNDILSYAAGQEAVFSDEVSSFGSYDDLQVIHCDYCGEETDSYLIYREPKKEEHVCGECYREIAGNNGLSGYPLFSGAEFYNLEQI